MIISNSVTRLEALHLFPLPGDQQSPKDYLLLALLHAIEPFLVGVNIPACHIEMVPIIVNALHFIVNVPVIRFIVYMHIYIHIFIHGYAYLYFFIYMFIYIVCYKYSMYEYIYI